MNGISDHHENLDIMRYYGYLDPRIGYLIRYATKLSIQMNLIVKEANEIINQ